MNSKRNSTVKHLLRGVAAVAVTAGGLLSGSLGGASTAHAEDVKFLGLWPMSGPFADMGPLLDKGAQIALEEIDYTINGKKIVYITRDSETKAGSAARRAQEAIDSEGVKFIVGPWSSGVALAVNEVAKKNKVLYYFSGGTEDIAGKRCHKYGFQWAANAWTAINADLKIFKKAHPDAKKIYLFITDFAFGWSLQKYVEALAPKYGLEVVGVDRQALGTREYSSFITKAMAADPDAIFMVNFGQDTIAAIRQLHNFGFTPKKPVVMAWSAGVEELVQMTPEMRANLIVGTNYYYSVKNPENDAFVAAYKKKNDGVPPGYAPGAAYGMMKVILKAMKDSGKTDPAGVAKAMEGMDGKTIIGSYHVNNWNHQTVRPYFVLQTKPESKMADKYDFADIVDVSGTEQPKDMNQCADIGGF